LQFDGRRHHHQSDRVMAKIVAGHLVRHLEQSGFVLMKKPPLPDQRMSHGRHRHSASFWVARGRFVGPQTVVWRGTQLR